MTEREIAEESRVFVPAFTTAEKTRLGEFFDAIPVLQLLPDEEVS